MLVCCGSPGVDEPVARMTGHHSAASPGRYRAPNDIQMFTNAAANPMRSGTSQAGAPLAFLSRPTDGRLADTELDGLLEDLSATSRRPARRDLVIRINDIISAQSGPVIPLVNRGNVAAIANDIEGLGGLNGWGGDYWEHRGLDAGLIPRSRA